MGRHGTIPYVTLRMSKIVTASNQLQQNYRYTLVAPMGKEYHAQFSPDLTPPQMLELGVFGGYYLHDSRLEFPKSWFTHAKLAKDAPDPSLNYFHVAASQPLTVWQKKGWINAYHDPRGWFQWYCRYYMGRRISDDERQIQRWRQMQRHVTQLKNNCQEGDLTCRPKQRQALLHWAYDSRKI